MNWEEAAGYSIELDEVDGKIVWRSVLDRGVKVERNEMSCYEREQMLKELYLKVKATYNGKKLMNYEDDGVGDSQRNMLVQDYPNYEPMKRSGVGSEMDSAERCKQKQPVESVSASRQIVNALPSLRAKWNRGPVKKKTSFRKRKRAESHVCDSKPTMQTLPTGAAGEIHNNVQHQQQENGATNVSQPPMFQPMPVESLKGVNTPTPSSVSPIVNACWYLLLKELAKSKDDGGRSSEALERLMNPAAQPVPKNDEKLSGEQKVISSGEKVMHRE